MANLINIATITIGKHYLPAIYNSDSSNLDEKEEQQLSDFMLARFENCIFKVITESDLDTQNLRVCDITHLLSDCVSLEVYKPESECKILSIDAWKGLDSWIWNSWNNTGVTLPLSATQWSTRKILKWFRDNGLIKDSSIGKLTIEDDQYNIVIIDRKTNEPLFAIEYGPHI